MWLNKAKVLHILPSDFTCASTTTIGSAWCRYCVNLLKTSQRKSEKEILSLATVHLPEMISSNGKLTITTFQARSEYASQIQEIFCMVRSNCIASILSKFFVVVYCLQILSLSHYPGPPHQMDPEKCPVHLLSFLYARLVKKVLTTNIKKLLRIGLGVNDH